VLVLDPVLGERSQDSGLVEQHTVGLFRDTHFDSGQNTGVVD